MIIVCIVSSSKAQEVLNLYPNGIPNTLKDASLGDNVPEFYLYKPDQLTQKTVFLIIPGGGYSGVAMRHEGHDVAKRLKEEGYASFLLRYRLPNDAQMEDKRVGPIQDAQHAMVFIHEKANELGVEVKDIAVIGFSAGGHLASTLSTHFDTSYIGNVDTNLLRPDYSVLVYPVITMQEGITHFGSKNNLIGPVFKQEDVALFSNELHVDERTPPTFIVHAEDDKAVPIENAYLYKKKLDEHHVPNSLRLFKKGGHGFGMYNKEEEGDWFAEMLKWIKN